MDKQQAGSCFRHQDGNSYMKRLSRPFHQNHPIRNNKKNHLDDDDWTCQAGPAQESECEKPSLEAIRKHENFWGKGGAPWTRTIHNGGFACSS